MKPSKQVPPMTMLDLTTSFANGDIRKVIEPSRFVKVSPPTKPYLD
jgi:hypothetical protein